MIFQTGPVISHGLQPAMLDSLHKQRQENGFYLVPFRWNSTNTQIELFQCWTTEHKTKTISNWLDAGICTFIQPEKIFYFIQYNAKPSVMNSEQAKIPRFSLSLILSAIAVVDKNSNRDLLKRLFDSLPVTDSCFTYFG